MRSILILLCCLSLLSLPGCSTHGTAKSEYVFSPYAVAIIIPAYVVKHHEDDPTVYDKVKFPLFCGYAMVYPEKNSLVFVQKTDLPIYWVKEHVLRVEQNGYVIRNSAHSRRKVYVRDKDFFASFIDALGSMSIGTKSMSLNERYEVPDTVPQFSRMCPYDSRKDPPVECGYGLGD
ncbi:hypothetical protein LJC26_09045, partial [Desulfovibrio sp. OttesenSCG-928-O18]|nr:hypothetical protein [Desulfovibrio sp. OttesenSCG-928-O18]